MTDKIAAVWARVSTEERQEPSLPSQVADVKAWLEGLGWTVPEDRIIMTHWTSKNILACPDMQKLLSWVRNGEVGAVGLLHLDRFACRLGQMAQILDTFREAEAEILAKNSPLQSGSPRRGYGHGDDHRQGDAGGAGRRRLQGRPA